jgi:osmoprotectant transport system permease protein
MRVRDPVALLLLVVAVLALWRWPLLTFAPNRLLTGRGIPLADLLHGLRWLLAAPACLLLSAPWWPPRRGARALQLLCCASLAAGLWALAGQEAWQRAEGDLEALVRVSFGGAFWVLMAVLGLLYMQALRALASARTWRFGTQVLVALIGLLPLVALAVQGSLDTLSLWREYRNHQDRFDAALGQHLLLVLGAVLPATVLGALLGAWAHRQPRVRAGLMGVLGVVQTVPSIALFALLIAPLAWLGRVWPASGVAGVGLAPAWVALTLYGLLPVAQATLAGLAQVPAGARDAARGLGMSAWQVFARVELPLAWPVFLGGVRVTAVQAVGLACVAALIGAGGFGSLLFEGLSGSAVDLVLLGVLPVVALSLAVDTAFKLIPSPAHLAVLTPPATEIRE